MASESSSWKDGVDMVTNLLDEHRPQKLLQFTDGWLYNFRYSGAHAPGAVYLCQKKVTAWAIIMETDLQKRVSFHPKLLNGRRGHPQSGLKVLELQGLDDATSLLIVREMYPNNGDAVRYGLVLKNTGLDQALLEPLNRVGLLNPPDPEEEWTAGYINEQWTWMEELRRASLPPSENTPSGTTPATKSRKRKTLTGGPGDVESAEKATAKKAKPAMAMTLDFCVQMDSHDIDKLKPPQMVEIRKLYTDTFGPLYQWGDGHLVGEDQEPIRVHVDHLHKAPPRQIVYRRIQQERLTAITNQTRIQSGFNCFEAPIVVLPLKFGKNGSRGKVEYFVDAPPVSVLTDANTDFFIIGGQHTVEAHKNLLDQNEILQSQVYDFSRFRVIPVWCSPKDKKLLPLLSRVLNQELAGPQKEQTFMQQLKHGRVKWTEMGRPQPSQQGRLHSQEYRDFKTVATSMFTNMKPGEKRKGDLNIPLLYVEDDDLVDRWYKIEEKFMDGRLPDAQGVVDVNEKLKRKPLTQNDLRILYGMRSEDIEYLTDLVERKEISVKTSAAKAGDRVASLPGLHTVGKRERQVRSIKNELMLIYRKCELPSKKKTYVPYLKEEYDELAKEGSISRTDLNHWIDRALSTSHGKSWLEERTNNFSNTSTPKDCPPYLLALFNNNMQVTGQVASVEEMRTLLPEKYMCAVMARGSGDITEVLQRSDIRTWRRSGSKYLYIWMLFHAGEDCKPREDVVDDSLLDNIFKAMEAVDDKNIVYARSPTVLVTDVEGLVRIFSHLEKRKRMASRRVWSVKVVHYLAALDDGFPAPDVGTSFNAYCVFCYGYDANNTAQQQFRTYFLGKKPLDPAYSAMDFPERVHLKSRPGMANMRLSILTEVFEDHLSEDMVLVNVNGGPHWTYLGLDNKCMVLEVVYTDHEKQEASTFASETCKVLFNEEAGPECCDSSQNNVDEEDPKDPAFTVEQTSRREKLATKKVTRIDLSVEQDKLASSGHSLKKNRGKAREVDASVMEPSNLSAPRRELHYSSPTTPSFTGSACPGVDDGFLHDGRRHSVPYVKGFSTVEEVANVIRSLLGSAEAVSFKTPSFVLQSEADTQKWGGSLASSEKTHSDPLSREVGRGRFTEVECTLDEVVICRKSQSQLIEESLACDPLRFDHEAAASHGTDTNQSDVSPSVEVAGNHLMMLCQSPDVVLNAVPLRQGPADGAGCLVADIPLSGDLQISPPIPGGGPGSRNDECSTGTPLHRGGSLPDLLMDSQRMEDVLESLLPLSPERTGLPLKDSMDAVGDTGLRVKSPSTTDRNPNSGGHAEGGPLLDPGEDVALAVEDAVRVVSTGSLSDGEGMSPTHVAAPAPPDEKESNESESPVSDRPTCREKGKKLKSLRNKRVEGKMGTDLRRLTRAERAERQAAFKEQVREFVRQRQAAFKEQVREFVRQREAGLDPEMSPVILQLQNDIKSLYGKEYDIEWSEQGTSRGKAGDGSRTKEEAAVAAEGVGRDFSLRERKVQEKFLRPIAVEVQEVTRGRRYHIVLDLNGVLVHRGNYTKGQERTVVVRPGCGHLLEWIHRHAVLSFWSSMTRANAEAILGVLLGQATVRRGDVRLLAQTSCTQTGCRDPHNPNKLIFLKDLSTYARCCGLKSTEDVLLVDDSPMKNDLNDKFNAVHPPSWVGQAEDSFLAANLRPWLERLLRSDISVPDFVRDNSLPGAQLLQDNISSVTVTGY